MTKICVFSDSHGDCTRMLRAVELEQPDMILHLGDGAGDLERLRQAFPALAYHNVQGNCDYRPKLPRTLRLQVEGITIFAAHGHEHQVKLDPDLTRFRYAALEAGADLALYGHTHRSFLGVFQGMTILNPGSIGLSPRPSYGVITVEGSRFTPELRQG